MKSSDSVNGEVPPAPHSVLVVDDHPVVREALTLLLRHQADFTVAGEAQSAAEARQAVARLRPDLMVLDLSLPDGHGLELIKDIRAQSAGPQILVFTLSAESAYAVRALRAGANGYLMKNESPKRALEALRMIVAGELAVSPAVSNQLLRRFVGAAQENTGPSLDSLTDRELEVFELLGKGAGTREIASYLQRSVSAVEACRVRIKEKLQFKDYAEVLCRACQWVECGTVCLS